MTLDVPGWLWVATIGLYVVLFVVDLVIVGRRPHVPTTAECVRWLSLYVGIAILFGIGLGISGTRDHAVQYYAGWITEYSLSIDNLFVFLLIMARFYVPRHLQQAVLMYGILIAIALRAVFIAVGAAVIANFSWVFYIFGAFLVYTGVKLATQGTDEDEEYQESALVRRMGRVLRTTPDFDGTRLRTVRDGVTVWTPMLIVLIALGTTDLLFALDSIPAIFGLTQEPYIVLAANVFALLGLRQLYFLLGGLLERLVYLSLGLALVLGYIGVKLVLEALHSNELPFLNGGQAVPVPVPSTFLSLGIILGILAITAVASLLRSRADARTE